MATISAVQEQQLKVLSFPLGNTDEKALKPTPGNDKSRDSEDGGDDNMDVSINQTRKRESADDDEVSSESDDEATKIPLMKTNH